MNMIDMLVNSIVTKVKQTNETKTEVNIDSNEVKDEIQNNLPETIVVKGITMKISDIENRILEKYGEELKDKPVKEVVRVVVKAVFEEISDALANKESVQIYKFGRFYPKFVKGKEGFNHATGKPFVSKDKYVPKFEPSDVLKEKVAPVETKEDTKE